MRRALACALASALVAGTVPVAAFADYPSPNPQPMPNPGDQVIHGKFGDNAVYTVVSSSAGGVQGTAAVGDGASPAFPAEATGTVFIPEDVYIVYDWEKACTYEVTGIKAHAFDYGAGACPFDTVVIEGDVALEPDALAGLSDAVRFVTYSETMARTLTDAGVPADRVSYEPLRTRYVAFGDSISAGFALSEYDSSILTYDGRMTPSDAFPTLTGAFLESQHGTTVADNQSTSGWTSKQLLDQLNRGDYAAALAAADVVSVTIGSNDLLGPFIALVKETLVEVFNQLADEVQAPELRVQRIEDLTPKRLRDLDDKAAHLGASKGTLIPDLVDALNAKIVNNPDLLKACDAFKNVTQPAILAKLHELAPSATIYWTTLYNPFYGTVVDLKELFPALKKLYPRRDLSVDLSTAGAYYIELMNGAFANPAGYEAVGLYEPFNNPGLTNVLIGRDPATNQLLFGVDPHPNHDGHKIIADLLNARIAATYTPKPVQPIVPETKPTAPETKPIQPNTPETKPAAPEPKPAAPETKPSTPDQLAKTSGEASDAPAPAKKPLARTGDAVPAGPVAALLVASAACVAFAWRRRTSMR